MRDPPDKVHPPAPKAFDRGIQIAIALATIFAAIGAASAAGAAWRAALDSRKQTRLTQTQLLLQSRPHLVTPEGHGHLANVLLPDGHQLPMSYRSPVAMLWTRQHSLLYAVRLLNDGPGFATLHEVAIRPLDAKFQVITEIVDEDIGAGQSRVVSQETRQRGPAWRLLVNTIRAGRPWVVRAAYANVTGDLHYDYSIKVIKSPGSGEWVLAADGMLP